MKGKILLAALVLGIVSCSPSTYTLAVDLRQPSNSGIDLGGKSMSVVYLDNGDSMDSLYIATAAESFASALEGAYFSGEESIDIYSMISDGSSDYSQKDTLVKLVIDTDADVVFLFDEKQNCDTLSMYVYDSMGNDSVLSYRAANYRKRESAYVGTASATKFLPNWKTESFTIYYYENDDWLSATYDAIDMNFKSAMGKWLECLDTRDVMKRACAEYNIATACFFLSKYSLASEWLDAADADYSLPLSPGLRKRINSEL